MLARALSRPRAAAARALSASAHPDRPPPNVRNALTRRLEPLAPGASGVLGWYQCGPTVYAAAHVGHAATYVTFDVLRRVLEGFFGYEVPSPHRTPAAVGVRASPGARCNSCRM